MNLVLNEEIYQGDQSTEEARCQSLPILHSLWIIGAKGQAAQGPRNRSHKIRDHEDIMPAMIIC